MNQPILLNASLGNYSSFASRKNNSNFRKLAAKIYSRDNYTCQFCGFQAKEFQEVVNFNQDYRKNAPDNLKTACCFCAQCFFLESLGEGGYGGGTLIYLPEFSQNELNSLCHVLFCAMVNTTPYKDSAQSIYRTLRMRSRLVDEEFGEGVSEANVFGQLLIEYEVTHGKKPTELVKNLRLLPNRSRFKRQVEVWAKSAVATME